jgi:hypothetical protein
MYMQQSFSASPHPPLSTLSISIIHKWGGTRIRLTVEETEAGGDGRGGGHTLE